MNTMNSLSIKQKYKGKKNFWILFAVIIFITVGCSPQEEAEEEPVIIEEEEEEEKTEDSEEEIEELVGIPSPLSGIYVEETELLERPVVGVMYDNHPSARPQAGFYDAEIIYEFYVEGNATRYLAFFLLNDPEMMGPIRSARPYYIEKAMEYDAIYVHAGASSRVTDEIRSLGIENVSLSGPGSNAFWRESHKRAPHNAYTSMENIRNTGESLNYRDASDFNGYEFHKEKEALDSGQEAINFEVRYHSNYRVEYRYDSIKKEYDRYYVDQQQYDENQTEENEKRISASNILVQIVPTRLIPGTGSGILEMDTIGSGKAYYFTMGEVTEVKWEKNNMESFTRYYDMEGKEIILNPGKTWVQVVPSDELLTIEKRDF